MKIIGLIIFNLINLILINSKILKRNYKFDNNTINKTKEYTINILSISYELLHENKLNIKVTLKLNQTEKIASKINFKAFLKFVDNINEFPLDCSYEFLNIILCLSNINISPDLLKKKFYFYYNKNRTSSSIFINGKEIFEDKNKISAIFHPIIINNQILYKNRKLFRVINRNNTISNGKLYIVRKSKKILKNQEKGFNKYIELNNYIFRGGITSFTLKAYKIAIKKGYRMVDADIVFTKDDIPIISHGWDLEKISNGTGYIFDKTYKELEKLDFGCKLNKYFCGEKIMKFEDLLILCKQNNIIIDLDIQHLNYSKFFNNTKKYIKLIIEYVEKNEMINSIIFNEERI